MIKSLIFLLVFSNAQESCFVDSDCLELNSCRDGLCEHKSLFPLATSEIAGIVVMIVVSTIANAGGVGGSSMTISLMLLMHKFNPHTSVALTQVFIFAGTCTATVLKIRDRHPTRDRPLIYYDVLMQIVSPILIGVSVGVTVNAAFPGWLILALLTLVVICLVYDSLKRSIQIYKKEKAAEQVVPIPSSHSKSFQSEEVTSGITKQVRSEVAVKVVHLKLENDENVERERKNSRNYDEEGSKGNEKSERNQGKQGICPESGSLKSLDGEEVPENDSISLRSEEREKDLNDEIIADNDDLPARIDSTQISHELLRKVTTIYQEEKKIIAWVPLCYFFLLAGASILFSLVKGNSASKSIVGIEACSAGYFGVTVAYLGFMFLMNFASSVYLVRKTQICERTNYVFDEGDIHWTYGKCGYVTLCSVVAGMVVGLLGMGGGNLIGPMLLALGVRPEISTISSSFTIFISSGTASAQYFITGVIDLQYSAWFFGLSVLGSILGILVLRKIAIKKQRVSLLIFCLFFILFSSLVIIPTIGVLNAIKQNQEGNFQLGFKNLC